MSLTPPKFAAIFEQRNEAAKRRQLLEDFAEFASLPDEIVDMYLESQ